MMGLSVSPGLQDNLSHMSNHPDFNILNICDDFFFIKWDSNFGLKQCLWFKERKKKLVISLKKIVIGGKLKRQHSPQYIFNEQY